MSTAPDPYLNDDMSEEDFDALNRDLIKSQFDEELKDAFSKSLTTKYGVNRESQVTKESNRLTIKKFWMLTCAAALALLITAYMGLQFNNPFLHHNALVDTYINEKYPASPLLMRGAENDVLRHQAGEAFATKDYTLAIKYLSAITDELSKEEKYLYLGLSHLFSPNPDLADALKNLKLAQTSANQYAQETAWFLALAYVKSEDMANAKTLLQEIISQSPQHYKVQEAKKLLASLLK